MLTRQWLPWPCMMMSDSEKVLRAQLAAAQETIHALTQRMRQLESSDAQSPLQNQLKSYQERIEEKALALQDIHDWSELIVQNSMDAIVRLDQDGRIQSWNPMAEQMFGYRANEVMGRLLEGVLIPKRLHSTHLRHFHQHVRRGKGALMNKRLEGFALCKDGSELPVEFIGSVVKQSDAQAFVMVFRDISERIVAEQALRDSHASLEIQVQERTREVRHLATIIKLTTNFVGIADLEGHVFYVNPAGLKMVGLAQDISFNTLDFESFHDIETSQFIKNEVFPQILSQDIFETECEFMDQEGNRIPTACIFMSLTDEQGKADRVAVIARDMRKEIALQQEMEHVDRLESLGILAGGIAHDFNNILAAIIGNAGLARYRLDNDSPVQKYLHRIEQSGQQAANLCTQMLAYSGKGIREIHAIDLSKLVVEMQSLLEVSVDKTAVLEFNLCKAGLVIDADMTQMQQIIMNLVINASEALIGGRGTITISTGLMDIDEHYLQSTLHQPDVLTGTFVYLKVSDTGCGMDAEIIKKIFDPFFTTKFTGRGLGMSALLGIVHGHHGILKVDSTVGQGTTFNVALPLSSSRVEEEKSQEGVAVHKAAGGMVLVIDDEESVRGIAKGMLEHVGYTVVLANDGQDGVEVFAKHHKSIVGVILDMTMPRMNGEECYDELCKINPDVRVILSSGYSEQDAVDHFQGKGLAGFMKKPYKMKDFQRMAIECFSIE